MLDIALAVIMFLILSFGIMMSLFTEGGTSPRLSILLAFIVTFLTMTIFHAIRYPIIIIVIVVGAILLIKHYITVIQPQNKIQQKSLEFYGQQLAKYLQSHHVVMLDMYAHESFNAEDKPNQTRLFIASETYDSLIKANGKYNIRWEFVELHGLPDDNNFTNQLFLLLIIENFQAQSIVIPCFVGYQSKKESGYYGSEFWRSGLAKLYPKGELNLYPLQQQWIDELKYPNDVSTYFYTHVVDEPHLALAVPVLNEAMQLGLVSQQHLQREQKKSSRFVKRFDTYRYHEKIDMIQYATTLCESCMDNQHHVSIP